MVGRARARGLLREHRWFAALLGVGAVLRAVTMLGYRPAIWFPDSYTYVVTALKPRPDLVRPAGYPMFLRLLEPLHSFGAVALAQHLLGLAAGALVYLTARRLRVPAPAAALASAPVLLDAYQIELEHLLVSDTLFTLLVVAAVCLALAERVTRRTACGIGLLIAAATLTRTVGLPLVALFAGWLLYRARGRTAAAGVMLAAAVLPILAYGAWFHATYQRVGIVGANGVFLYSRTMAFADCAKMDPPADLAVLCDPRPPARRPPSQEYIWSPDAPLVKLPGITFSRENDELAGRFASLALRSQPLDYLASFAKELSRSFTWDRPVYPDAEVYGYYEFPDRTPPPPGRYPATVGAQFAERYEEGPIGTRIAEPYAGWMRSYQDVARLPGAVLLVILLAPPALAALRRLRLRRLRAHGARPGTGPERDAAAGPEQVPAAGPERGPDVTGRRAGRGSGTALWPLPWAVAVLLLVMPAAVAEFDHRYVLPAVPLACLALVLAGSGAFYQTFPEMSEFEYAEPPDHHGDQQEGRA
ncbi:hypothetical protein ACFOWE_06875 [Planomonospora corallina]|uniref:Glycosyltransferase RgtA/B/C/D-like domain-containing protein n=1 Tax=Planomonospora corallina TaxID=1806052 RepID=A0ABV8I1F2_9ACTN